MPSCRAVVSSISSNSNWETCPYSKKEYRWHAWNRDQEYEGEFFRGSLHGEGTYKWKGLAVYEGGFYSNHKEGYAVMSFPDNSCFEGLFVRNKRFGPGIFTHSNGRQDAGFWKGEKLVRLSRSVDFIVPRLAPTSAAKIKLLQFRRLIPIDEDELNSFNETHLMCECPSNFLSCPYSSLIFDPRSCFFDKGSFERTYFLNQKDTPDTLPNGYDISEVMDQDGEEEEQQAEELVSSPVPSHCLCADKTFVMNYRPPSLLDVCDKDSGSDVEMGILAYFSHYGTIEGLENKNRENEIVEEVVQGEGVCEKEIPKLLAWNRSELCTEMLQQIFRYRGFEGKLTFNIAKLMLGARMEFRKTGEREKECLEFLKTCALGPPRAVKAMLCDYGVSEELTDARGNNSVMFAAATDQREIIDVLADYGVDVNSFNDESLTPLNLCLLRRLAQVYNLGNWEKAFLPKEIETPDDENETEEWRKRISIPSLDRIFGDGKSVYEVKDTQPVIPSPEKETIAVRSKSLTISEMSSAFGLPMLSRSMIDTGRVFPAEESVLLSLRNDQSASKTKQDIQIQPNKMEEFEISVGPSSKGSYFFELAPQKKSEMEDKREGSLRDLGKIRAEEEEENTPGEEGSLGSKLRTRTLEIDKTIVKLLKRGADPDVSEVPKPSIHLGVYTKDRKIVQLLLSYGANPNNRLYSNEGLLTPLHVLVLLKSDTKYVDICDLLLNFGANPEEETHPEFAFHEEEKPFLDLAEGRTPLQLLCMRPDLEYADPGGSLIQIALMLAEVSNRARLYRGYSYLALAMWFGNLKLLKALLESKYFDPNALLGNDMGTTLHLLVSTEFQKKTLLDTSIQICDLLLEAKAKPSKRFNYPEKLAGTCIDYGYREIEAEKAARNLSATDKKETGKKDSEKKSGKKKGKTEKAEQSEKSFDRDHLPDHIKVLEYLCKRVEEMKRRKKRGKDDPKNTRERSKLRKSAVSKEVVSGDENEKEPKSEQRVETAKKTGDSRLKQVADKRTDTVSEGKWRKERNGGNEKNGGKEKIRGKEINEGKEKIRGKEINEGKEKIRGKEINEGKEKIRGKEINEGNEKNGGKEKIGGKEKKGGKKEGGGYTVHSNDGFNDEKNEERGKVKEREKEKRSKIKRESKNVSEPRKRKKGKVSRKKKVKKTASGLSKLKSSLSKSFGKKQPSQTETFPEKLRQSMLKLFGNCANLDVNELFLPYVVLRDGDLYYDFKRQDQRGKEQYSLI